MNKTIPHRAMTNHCGWVSGLSEHRAVRRIASPGDRIATIKHETSGRAGVPRTSACSAIGILV